MELTSLLPPRSVEDILFERVRLMIGGKVYDLPALVIEDNEAWKTSVDETLRSLLDALDAADNDVTAIVGALTGEPERLLGLLRSYDKTGILPDDETLRKTMTPIGLFRAVLEVWRAANPLVDIGLLGVTMPLIQPSGSAEPTSSPRRNGAGRRASSAAS